MSPTVEGSIILVTTVATLLTGIPVAFGLGALAVIFLVLFQGIDSIQVVAETFYSSLDEFTLVAIPMFIMMGAAIGFDQLYQFFHLLSLILVGDHHGVGSLDHNHIL